VKVQFLLQQAVEDGHSLFSEHQVNLFCLNLNFTKI